MSTPVGRRLERTPLRVSLVASVLLLVATALVIAGVLVTAALRGYLLDRVDDELFEATEVAVDNISSRLTPFPSDSGRYRLPSDYVVQVSDAEGTVVRVLSSPVSGADSPAIPGVPVDEAAQRDGSPYTVVLDGSGWRVVSFPFVDGSGSLTVATSLEAVEETVQRMALIQAVVAVVVLVVIGIAGYALVRRSLRPLRQVEATAAAITAGDLTQRVPEMDPRTEVGAVSVGLNTMLAEVQQSFERVAAAGAAAAASEERTKRFVADASHELRTPLTSIRGFAELYRRGDQDPEQVAASMLRIEQEAARMGLLVADMLLLARLDEQRALDRAPVDMLAVAVDTVTDARAVAPDRSIVLETVGDGEAAVVMGDEPRLRQVAANLMANAVAHTPDGTPVTVRVGVAQDGAGSSVLLEVEDRGPGLASDDVERVFERFARADSSRSRDSGGVGLGLSIVSAIVAGHGGRVEVSSHPGEGATFRVLLPRADA